MRAADAPTQSEVDQAYEVIHRHRRAELARRAELDAWRIGKLFKFHNSNDGARDRWWRYAKPLRLEDGGIYGVSFEHQPDGEVRIGVDRYLSIDHWTECGAVEFNEAAQAIVSAVSTARRGREE